MPKHSFNYCFSIALAAFRPNLESQSETFTSTVKFDNRVLGTDDEKNALLLECKGELYNSVIGKCGFSQPGYINGFFEPILKTIILQPTTFDSDANIKDFLLKYTYFTPRVMRTKLQRFECCADKLFAYYDAHRTNNEKDLGIEKMTDETMKLIGKLVEQPEDALDENNKSQFI